MAIGYTISQIASLDANAGNQNTVTYSQTVGLTNNNPYAVGPSGAASDQASTVPLSSDGTPLPAASTSPSWVTWFLIACLAYFGFQWSKN